jgi:hypothetical protein
LYAVGLVPSNCVVLKSENGKQVLDHEKILDKLSEKCNGTGRKKPVGMCLLLNKNKSNFPELKQRYLKRVNAQEKMQQQKIVHAKIQKQLASKSKK